MMRGLYLLGEETIFFEDVVSHQEYQISSEDSFVFVTKKNNQFEFLCGELTSNIENAYGIILSSLHKEIFYVKAIKNLIKQKEYINLLYQHRSNLITDEEFSIELDNNESKYLIDVDQDLKMENIGVIFDIYKKLDIDLTDDELSEIFSIDIYSTSNVLTEHIKTHAKICP